LVNKKKFRKRKGRKKMKDDFKNYKSNNPTEEMLYPFRKGKVKQPSQKRIQKVSGKKMSSFKVAICYLVLPFRLNSLPTVIKMLFVIINKFFLIQFLVKFHIMKIPVTHVDHALDKKVPFEPKRVDVYLDFINFWIRPLAMLIHRFGSFNGIPLCAEFMRYITLTYSQAARMYRCNMTTTNRPDYEETAAFRQIHKADPHLLCVPSLHIAIVCLVFSFYRMIFERENFTDEEKTQWNKELYDHAIKIAETVLYVKQHSVNCIPAALYMMTKITPELFTTTDAFNFINSLFLDAPQKSHVSKEDRDKIIEHIQFTYERFLLEGAAEDDWFNPVLRWVRSYKAE